MIKENIGGPKAYKNLENPRVIIKEGEDRDNKEVVSAPEMTELEKENLDTDSERLKYFEEKKKKKTGKEFRDAEEVSFDATEELGAYDNDFEDRLIDKIDSNEEEDEELNEIRGYGKEYSYSDVLKLKEAGVWVNPKEFKKLSRGEKKLLREKQRRIIENSFIKKTLRKIFQKDKAA